MACPGNRSCDLKGRDNEAAKLYGIKGIPQSVLVGPDGMIVAKNLRGDDLLVKLHELFGRIGLSDIVMMKGRLQ